MKPRLKLVPGFAGLFAGSDGSIWRCRRFVGRAARWNGWRRLIEHPDQDGYAEVNRPGGEKKPSRIAVHKLVALAFHGPRPSGLVTTHLNGNKADNVPSNLAYRTPAANVMDKIAHGTMRRGEHHYRSKLTDEQTREILSCLASGEFATVLARRFQVHVGTVHAIKSGRVRRHLAQSRH